MFPKNVNVYESVKEMASAGEADAIMLINALHKVFEKFKIEQKLYPALGNVVLRFSLWIDSHPNKTIKGRQAQFLFVLNEALVSELASIPHILAKLAPNS